ncbi:uncharacterized protein LOC106667137 isoform X2 [Cimex lectularius]|uniref:Ig-like domain-containing protein n=1 Tax=Cimex lectularius TaxID=79782 RepID=A0A8I6RRR3_CIMLE|nr:uncharacterized protein LOC106667137 isoform X2 [Cimex lectularius]
MLVEILVILVVLPRIPGDCPPQCECKWKNGKESVICVNGNLTRIPGQLEAGTQLLDLTGNILISIAKDAFKNAGLLNLQKIYIAKCRIRTMDKYAFRKIINLVELDLSYNSLNTVPSHIFDSISKLRELKLNGNPIQKIGNDAFSSVPLVKLEISDCKLASLDPNAFAGLENSLEWLKVDRNRLKEIQPTTLTSLLSLHGLELSSNPWNCSCVLRPLRQWMLNNNIPTSVPPLCKYPSRIESKSWDKLSVDEFACSPDISPVRPSVKTEEGTNVSLSCTVTGNPLPSVKWVWKNKPLDNSSAHANNKKVYTLRLVNKKSTLIVHSTESSDAGVYFCVATNKAGRVEGNVTLSVTKKIPETKISGKMLFGCSVVGFLLLVATCLLLCLLGQPRKESRATKAESYEKIEMDKKGDCINDISVSNKIHPTMGEYRSIPTFEQGEGDDENGSPNSNHSDAPRPANRQTTRELSASKLYCQLGGVQPHILRKEVLPTASLYTTAISEERNYPDLVTYPPTSNTAQCSATLPRSKIWYPMVSSSQSPLLAGSRCGSSAGESSGSNRRFSAESRSSSNYRLPGKSCERSVSSLNLCIEPEISCSQTRQKSWHHPSLPTSPVRYHMAHKYDSNADTSETPILNLLGSAVYDYHAAQLERFLEEYRSLQDELNRMKETCEGLKEKSIEKPALSDFSSYRYTSNSIYNDLFRN